VNSNICFTFGVLERTNDQTNTTMETTANNITTGMTLRIEGCRATGYVMVKKIKTSAKGWVKFTFDIVDGYIQEDNDFKYLEEVRGCQKWRFGSHGSNETITMHPNGKIFIAE